MTSNHPSLTRAAADGDVETVRDLLAQGADVNARSSGGQTAIMLAVIGGHEAVVRVLHAAGADARLQDNLGLTVFDWAERRGFQELTRPLEQPRNLPTTTPAVVAKTAPTKPTEPDKPKASAGDRSQQWLEGMKKRWQEEDLRNETTPVSKPVASTPVAKPEPVTQVKETAEVRRPIEAQPIRPEPVPQPSEVKSRMSGAEPVAAVPIETRSSPNLNQAQNQPRAPDVESLVIASESGPEFGTEPPGSNLRWLGWAAVVITLVVSATATYFLYGYFYPSPPPAAPAAVVEPIPESVVEKKNSPVVSEALAGKELRLLDPEYPARAKSRGIGGSVTVRVTVNRRGRVVLARSTGGDWQLRTAAVAAATKSTFDPTKLPERGTTQGTIKYTFVP